MGKTSLGFMEIGVGKKYRIGKCSFVHRQQGLFLLVFVDDRKIGRKDAKSQTFVEEIDETR